MNWLKDLCSAIVEEICLESSYGKELGTDTFRRWLGTVVVFLVFYWVAYNFDGWFELLDSWFYEQFGWEKSTPPSPGKVSLHRTIAAGLSSITILAATIEYVVWIHRRMRARRSVALSAQKDLLPPTGN